MTVPDIPAHVARLIAYFESMTPETVPEIAAYYTDDAYFKDPFNEVSKCAEIEAIFAHMFVQLEAPYFSVQQWIGGERDGFLIWVMHFRSRLMKGGGSQSIRGVSHLRFNTAGRINYHRDYWDTGEELYAKLPVIGWFVRWLRNRAG